MAHFGVLVFPGSNCESDCRHAVREILNQPCDLVWHEETSLEGIQCVVIPGGFSYGDYLRAGAIARFSPVMGAVAELAGRGTPVVGICNGFQILVESGLLPGAFTHNSSLRFVCRWTWARVESSGTPFTHLLREGEVLRLPVANARGNFVPPPREDGAGGGSVVLRYCGEDGTATAAANPSGARDNIAAIASAGGNVLGMMPHPERSFESLLGSRDGIRMFECAVAWIESSGKGAV